MYKMEAIVDVVLAKNTLELPVQPLGIVLFAWHHQSAVYHGGVPSSISSAAHVGVSVQSVIWYVHWIQRTRLPDLPATKEEVAHGVEYWSLWVQSPRQIW